MLGINWDSSTKNIVLAESSKPPDKTAEAHLLTRDHHSNGLEYLEMQKWFDI
jgi:hypothetical protein